MHAKISIPTHFRKGAARKSCTKFVYVPAPKGFALDIQLKIAGYGSQKPEVKGQNKLCLDVSTAFDNLLEAVCFEIPASGSRLLASKAKEILVPLRTTV